MWDYFCPACKAKTSKRNETCPHCGIRFEVPPEKRRAPPEVLKDRKALEAYVHKSVFPKLSKAELEWLTPFFTVIFADGFDDGTADAWTGTNIDVGNTLTFDSAVKHHGAYSAKSVTDAGGWAYPYKSIVDTTLVYVREYVRFQSLIVTAGNFARLIAVRGNNNANLDAGVDLYKNGANQSLSLIRYYPATLRTSYDYAFAVDTWYCVQIKFFKAASPNGEYRVWLDGNEVISDTGLNTSGAYDADSISAANAWSFGEGLTMWLDCVVIADVLIGEEIDLSVSDGFTIKSSGEIELEKVLSLPADGLSLYDSLPSVRFTHNLTVYEPSRLYDFVSYGLAKTRMAEDGFTLYDYFAYRFLRSVYFSDGLSLSDSISSLFTRRRALTDALNFADLIARSVGRKISQADSLTHADVPSRTFARSVKPTDSLAAADYLVQLRQFNKLQLDSLTLADFTYPIRAYPRTFTDALSLADALYMLKIKNMLLTDYYRYGDGDLPIDSGLVLFLPMEEGTGSITRDASQNGNDGTIDGASWDTGKYGNALSFDGVTGNKVDLTSVISTPDSFTVVAWWKRVGASGGINDNSFHMIFKAINGEPDTYLVIASDGTEARFYFEGSGAKMALKSISDASAWHHIAAVWDGANLVVYVDGTAGTPVAVASPIASGATLPRIGIYLTNYYYANGIIDEVRTYNQALSAEEIRLSFLKGWMYPRIQLLRYRQLTTEALTLADAVARRFSRSLSPADALTLADALYKQRSITEAPRDYLTLADSAKVSRDRRLSLADSLTLSDSTYKLIQLTRTLTDALTLADSVSSSMVTPEFNITLTDALTLAETLTTQIKKILLLLDGVTLADSPRLSRAVNRAITDGHTLRDELLRQMKRAVSLSDAATLADALRIAINRYRSSSTG